MILVLTTSYGGECVGRNRKNITIQLSKRIDALLRIGEKKVKVGGRVDGIHSVKTADSYRGTAQRLSLVCKSMGVYAYEDCFRIVYNGTEKEEIVSLKEIQSSTLFSEGEP